MSWLVSTLICCSLDSQPAFPYNSSSPGTLSSTERMTPFRSRKWPWYGRQIYLFALSTSLSDAIDLSISVGLTVHVLHLDGERRRLTCNLQVPEQTYRPILRHNVRSRTQMRKWNSRGRPPQSSQLAAVSRERRTSASGYETTIAARDDRTAIPLTTSEATLQVPIDSEDGPSIHLPTLFTDPPRDSPTEFWS